jgi:hypothetical protein
VSTAIQVGTTVPFDQFWEWLKHHENCIVRAGTEDCYLHDHESFHWHVTEDDHQSPLLELLFGKRLVADLAIEARDVLYVQVTPDTETGEPGRFLFELVGGEPEDPHAVYHVLLTHGLEDASGERGSMVH